jgi:tryptophanyl-tRNA synthetase
MITDPQKVYKGDPGRPEICPVYVLQEVYNRHETEEISEKCRSGALGCVECKKKLAAKLSESLAPLRGKRKELENDASFVLKTLEKGALEAKERARTTMDNVRESMNLARPNV